MNDEVKVRAAVDEAIAQSYDIDMGRHMKYAWEALSKNFLGFAGITLVQLFLIVLAACTLVGLIVVPHLMYGFYFIAHKVRKDEEYGLSDLFAGFSKFGKILRMGIIQFTLFFIIYLPFLAGYVLLIVGSEQHMDESVYLPISIILIVFGLIVMMVGLYYLRTVLFYAPYLILFGNFGVREAIASSRKLAMKKFWMLLLFMFVGGILAGLGTYLCYVGLLVSMPFYYFMIHSLYYEVIEDRNAASTDQLERHLVQ